MNWSTPTAVLADDYCGERPAAVGDTGIRMHILPAHHYCFPKRRHLSLPSSGSFAFDYRIFYLALDCLQRMSSSRKCRFRMLVAVGHQCGFLVEDTGSAPLQPVMEFNREQHNFVS